MNQDTYEMEVRYDLYCPICKHRPDPQEEDPCHTCLSNPVQMFSIKPCKFELANGETLPKRSR